jgi:catechol 2,3-dioxygenase-like lactoylglutathione lyase family enzyme
MSGLSSGNHIAFLTSDIDRLALFYEEVFGAAKVVDLPIPEPEGPGRHALISIGVGASLHAFEFSRIAPPPAAPMFQRGRIDHFALNVRALSWPTRSAATTRAKSTRPSPPTRNAARSK